ILSFFFQAEDGIRDFHVTGVQTCALPISTSREALINSQMRTALAKVAFMPFGLMIDRWRWGVFDGSITPDNYNAAWWELKAKYRSEERRVGKECRAAGCGWS